jgi:hypothetical protein
MPRMPNCRSEIYVTPFVVGLGVVSLVDEMLGFPANSRVASRNAMSSEVPAVPHA